MARGPRPSVADLVAGTSVALVAIPQSLAYAELAGLPPYMGLFAATLAPIAAAFFASSPYLQTGPTAITSLLTFGALGPLAATGDPHYILLAGLLALLVGAFRTLIGLLRVGSIAFFLSPPVLLGFTVGAAVLIVSSQLPTLLGVAKSGGVLASAAQALLHPSRWHIESLTIGALAAAIVIAGKRIHRLFPGVLVAAVAGLLYAAYGDYQGADLGEIPAGFLRLHLDLPWGELPALLLPSLVIAVVGFAEPTAIARSFAATERMTWDADREFISQGVANLASGLVGGFPVGGSFGRSALNRFSGAQSRYAGAVTGLVVLAFLPFASALAPLPTPVLAAIIMVAVSSLLKFGALADLFRRSLPQATIAATTFALTLALAPRVERALLIGVGLSLLVHAWRESRVRVGCDLEGDTLTLRPRGVLWFPTADALTQRILELLARYPAARRVIIDLGGLGRIDYSGAFALSALTETIADAAVELSFVNAPPQTLRILATVCPQLLPAGAAQAGEPRREPEAR